MPEIIPIKELKNTAMISKLCHDTDEPVYVTKNGYGDMVIMSIECYDGIFFQIQMYRDFEISEKQITEAKTKDAGQLLAVMRERYEV